jgi:hypothetical protein
MIMMTGKQIKIVLGSLLEMAMPVIAKSKIIGIPQRSRNSCQCFRVRNILI